MTVFEPVPIPTRPTKPRAQVQRDYARSEKGREALRRARSNWKKTDKGKESARRSESARRKRRRLERPFVAWDGEGVTRADGRHDYVLLANSLGHELRDENYLPTERILEFALEHGQGEQINVIYGAGYDWNCWLADLDETALSELYETGNVEWRSYRLAWRQGKMFSVAHRGTDRIALFYDVVSFFQCPFVKACDEYLGERFYQRERIVENKMLRSGFRSSDLDDIAQYNKAELVNLVALMDELRSRLIDANLVPNRWDGPGAIAVALMQREGVKDHKSEQPANIRAAARSAYYGGRFEVVRCGDVDAPAYEYDLNSAYPWAMQDLPSLTGGRWEQGRETKVHPFTLYRLRWKAHGSAYLPGPLPCRYPDGSVAYPRGVEGWYWNPEYEAALEYVKLYGGELEVLETQRFHPASDARPFAFVGPLYELRRALKEQGNGAHVAYKLGLNSLYGKLAQQVGARQDSRGRWHIPPYHQLEWAGYVTSKTRAAVLLAVLPKLSSVIAWETDAVFSIEPLDVPLGDGLGEWGIDRFRNLTYLQSGTYFADHENGKVITKTRGVDRGTLTREDVRRAWDEGNAETVEARLTRFMTLGQALHQDFSKWRRWITAPKNLSLYPGGKRIHVGCDDCRPTYRGSWHKTVLAPWAEPRESVEYPVLWENPGPLSDYYSELREGHYEGDTYDD